MEKKWLSLKEAAEYAGVGETTIRRWVEKQWINKYRAGGVTRFRTDEIDQVFQIVEEEEKRSDDIPKQG